MIAATSRADVGKGPWPVLPPEHSTILRALSRWDGAWYIDVARRGYPGSNQLPARIAFFPLYPMLIRATVEATGMSYEGAAVLVSTIFGGLAAVFVWILMRELTNRETADRAVALFSFFPGALVLSLAYSESLMLAAAAASLWCLIQRRWVLAGLAAAMATATRPNALALVPACAWAAWWAIRQRREWRSLAAPLLAPLGTLAYFLYLKTHTGSATAWFRSEHNFWHERVDLGGATIHRIAAGAHHIIGAAGDHRDINILLANIGFLFLLATLPILWRWRPPGPLVVYTIGAVGLAVFSWTIGPRPRMVMAAFPLVLATAAKAPRWLYPIIVATFAGFMATLAIISSATLAATP